VLAPLVGSPAIRRAGWRPWGFACPHRGRSRSSPSRRTSRSSRRGALGRGPAAATDGGEDVLRGATSDADPLVSTRIDRVQNEPSNLIPFPSDPPQTWLEEVRLDPTLAVCIRSFGVPPVVCKGLRPGIPNRPKPLRIPSKHRSAQSLPALCWIDESHGAVETGTLGLRVQEAREQAIGEPAASENRMSVLGLQFFRY